MVDGVLCEYKPCQCVSIFHAAFRSRLNHLILSLVAIVIAVTVCLGVFHELVFNDIPLLVRQIIPQ